MILLKNMNTNKALIFTIFVPIGIFAWGYILHSGSLLLSLSPLLFLLLPLSYYFPKYLFIFYYLYPIIILWITKGYYRNETIGVSIIGFFNITFIFVTVIYSIFKGKKINELFKNIPGFFYLVILALITFFLTFIHGDMFYYIKVWLRDIFIDIIILSFLYFIINENKWNGLKFIKNLLVTVLTLVIVFNLYNYLNGEHIRYIKRLGYTFARYDYHSGDAKMGANSFGALISIFVPFILYNIIISKRKIVKIFFLFIFSSSIFLILITASRGPVLAVFISILVFSFYLDKKNKILLYVLGIIGIIFLSSYIRIFLTEASQTDSTLMGRIYLIWLPTLSSGLKNNLFLGNGIGEFGKFSYTILGFTQSAHNIIIRFLYEIGIIGTSLYLLFYYKIFRNIYKNIPNLKNTRYKLLLVSFFTGLIAWWICALSAEVYNLLFRITNYIFIIGTLHIIKMNSKHLPGTS